MTKNSLVKLVDENLSIRKIAEKKRCSPSTIRYWLKKYGLKTHPYKNLKKEKCLVCKKRLTEQKIKFCSKKCKNKYYSSYDIEGQIRYQWEKGIKRKLKLIEIMGGECEKCGYKKNISALVFHHKNDKKIKLDLRSLSNRSWRISLEEAKKCKLLCANCHMELHYPQMDFECLCQENWQHSGDWF
jgi:transposase